MKEIVEYHNDFNKIKLPNFTAQEQNMLMGIICKIKELTTDEKIKLTPQELLEFSTDNLTNKALGDMLYVLREKFFKAEFTILVKHETKDLVGLETINLFEKFTLWYPKDDENFTHLNYVELKVNPQFKYLIDDLTKHFLSFELKEFMGLSSKYSKTLYRLLKQFRYTGECKIYRSKWDEFRDFMDIPESYLPHHIDQRVLNPAIQELSAERNLFNNARPIFENLRYKKIKDPKGRGRGGKVIGIEFYFTKQEKNNEISEQIKDLQSLKNQIEPQEPKKQKTEPKLNPITGKNINWYDVYIGRQFKSKNKFDGGYEICKIMAMNEIGGKVNLSAKNQEYENKYFTMNFENETHFKNWFKKTKTY